MEDKKFDYALVVTIVNRGYSDEVMAAAREAGARGGTIMYAHGASANETDKFFGISIHPEKEMVLIVTDEENRANLMRAIANKVGIADEGAGITFSLPVNEISGIAHFANHDD